MEQLSGGHAAYTVGGKKFAYLLEDHHWDGRLGLCFKAAEGTRRLKAEPVRFYSPAYIGARGWIGADLGAAAIDWEELAGLVVESYVRVAPTRLVRLIARAHSDARL